jgi:hypothetical protein
VDSADEPEVEALERARRKTEAHLAKVECDLLEAGLRLRLLFGDLGRQRRRIEALARRLDSESKGESQGEQLVLDYTNGDGPDT